MNNIQHIITETIDNNTNYISLNGNGELVKVAKNPLELPGFMTKEQAFKVVAALRKANPERKYRVKAASQALRDYVTDLIVNQLPEAPMIADEVIDKAVESWKPKVEAKKAEEQPAEAEMPVEATEPEAPAEPEQVETPVEVTEPEAEPVAEVTEAPVEEPKPEKKKGKKQNK